MKVDIKGKKRVATKKSTTSLSSMKYQCLKDITRIAKITKGFLLQKVIRNIKSCKIEGNDKDSEKLLDLVKELKETKQSVVAYQAVNVIFNGESLPNDASNSLVGVKQVLRHQKVLAAIQAWQKKVKAFEDIDKKRLSASEIKKSDKRLLPRDSNQGKAVFLDCLAESDTSNVTRLCRTRLSLQSSTRKKRIDSVLYNYMPNHLRPQEVVAASIQSSDGDLYVRPEKKLNHSDNYYHNNNPGNDFESRQQQQQQPQQPNRITIKSNCDNKNVLKDAIVKGKEWRELGVHPSWAAKQLKSLTNKPAIGSYQGKKITFDD